jgi:hypothetical protein
MKAILVVTLLLFSLLVGIVFVVHVNANPTWKWKIPTLVIKSPWDGNSTCYRNDSIPVLVLVTNSNNIVDISYCLDNQKNVTIPNFSNGTFAGLGIGIMGNTTLHNITEGNHTLRACSLDSTGNVLSDEVTFTVDSSYQISKLAFISPQNKTYETNQVQLTFTINKNFTNAKYILDDLTNFTKTASIEANTTLTNLSEGTHRLIVFAYAYDRYGSGIGNSISFTIDATKSQNNFVLNNQVTIIGLTILAIAILATIISLYKIRRKQE